MHQANTGLKTKPKPNIQRSGIDSQVLYYVNEEIQKGFGEGNFSFRDKKIACGGLMLLR